MHEYGFLRSTYPISQILSWSLLDPNFPITKAQYSQLSQIANVPMSHVSCLRSHLCLRMTWLPESQASVAILSLSLSLSLSLRSWAWAIGPRWPRLHTVSQWVSANLELDFTISKKKLMADDLKLLVPWSFWHIPLKDLSSFQKISYLEIVWAWATGPCGLDSTQSASGSQPNLELDFTKSTKKLQKK